MLEIDIHCCCNPGLAFNCGYNCTDMSLFQNYDNTLTKLAKDVATIKVRITKHDIQSELAIADAEGGLRDLLPLSELNANTDELMSNEVSAKVFASLIWYYQELKGHNPPEIAQLVNEAANLFFSPKLKAFLYVPPAKPR